MERPNYNQLEKNEAKRHGHKLTKNSGRGVVKGDASSDEFVIDYKFANKSFTLNTDVWAKVVTDALKADKSKYPCLILVIGDEKHKIRLAVTEYAVLEDLTNRAQEGIIGE